MIGNMPPGYSSAGTEQFGLILIAIVALVLVTIAVVGRLRRRP